MFALQTRAKDPAGAQRFGVVRCPRCAAAIDVVGLHLKLAEEFSIQCPGCHSRSFHSKTAMASSGAKAST